MCTVSTVCVGVLGGGGGSGAGGLGIRISRMSERSMEPMGLSPDRMVVMRTTASSEALESLAELAEGGVTGVAGALAGVLEGEDFSVSLLPFFFFFFLPFFFFLLLMTFLFPFLKFLADLAAMTTRKIDTTATMTRRNT